MLHQDGWLCLLVFCKACRHQALADLQSIIDSGRGVVPLKDLKFRCTNCGSSRTDHFVMSRDALNVQLRRGRAGKEAGRKTARPVRPAVSRDPLPWITSVGASEGIISDRRRLSGNAAGGRPRSHRRHRRLRQWGVCARRCADRSPHARRCHGQHVRHGKRAPQRPRPHNDRGGSSQGSAGCRRTALDRLCRWGAALCSLAGDSPCQCTSGAERVLRLLPHTSRTTSPVDDRDLTDEHGLAHAVPPVRPS